MLQLTGISRLGEQEQYGDEHSYDAYKCHKPGRILHISDLHFGWDGDESKRTNRTLALNGLLHQLGHLEAAWQPNIVCISGDIGWQGRRSDYEHAKQWIYRLLKQLQLSAEALVMCPGNHDLDRGIAKRNARPNSPAEADEVIGIPIPEHFQSPFQAFADFCKDIGIPPFFLGATETVSRRATLFSRRLFCLLQLSMVLQRR